MKDRENQFYVYMLRCKDGSLYTGYTVNLEKRVTLHQVGKASKYTRSRGPVELVYFERQPTKSEAMKREIFLKKLKKEQKEKLLVSTTNNLSKVDDAKKVT